MRLAEMQIPRKLQRRPNRQRDRRRTEEGPKQAQPAALEDLGIWGFGDDECEWSGGGATWTNFLDESECLKFLEVACGSVAKVLKRSKYN